MIKAVRANLSTLNYTGIIGILNETLKKNVLMASDMSFLKTTKLMDTFKKDLCYPSGFAAALKTINASTANLIANNIDLEFDLDKKCFVSRVESLNGNRPTATAKEMNMICSATETFDSMKKISNENAEYNGNEEDEFVEEIELMDFMDYLFRTPTLGSAHSAGKKIMEVIRNIWKSSCAVRAGVLCIRTSRIGGGSCRRPRGSPRRPAAIDGRCRPVGPGGSCFHLP